MAIPLRGSTGFSTYFTTSNIWLKRHLLQSYRSAELFIEILYRFRAEKKYLVHEFVVMPNHFHLLLTPLRPNTVERCLGLIKGSFSYQASRSFGFPADIWQPSFMHAARARLLGVPTVQELYSPKPHQVTFVHTAGGLSFRICKRQI